MIKKKNILSIALSVVPACAFAQASDGVAVMNDSVFTIIEAINTEGSSITVVQPMQIDRIVGKEESNPNLNAKRGYGFRIQVFSDNNMRTAKANAEYRKRMIESQMPDLRGYLTFESPYWRVRVGDFKSQAEASAALRELKSAFPAFASDMRIVRERINAPQ